ncbi:MAG: hypothetical protein ACI9KI_001767, partial [Patiriisocius sp.]
VRRHKKDCYLEVEINKNKQGYLGEA